MPGVELLDQEGDGNSDDSVSDNDESVATDNEDEQRYDVAADPLNEEENDEVEEDESGCESSENDDDDDDEMEEEESDDLNDMANTDNDEEGEYDDVSDESMHESDNDEREEENKKVETKTGKRKFAGQLSAADTSLRALKKLAGAEMGPLSSNMEDGIYSNEFHQRIKEVQVCWSFICIS